MTAELFPQARFHRSERGAQVQHIESAVNKMFTIFRQRKCIILNRVVRLTFHNLDDSSRVFRGMEGGDYERDFGNCWRTVYRLGCAQPRSARGPRGVHVSAVWERRERKQRAGRARRIISPMVSCRSRRAKERRAADARLAEGGPGGNVARSRTRSGVFKRCLRWSPFQITKFGRLDQRRVTFGECPERRLLLPLTA